MRKVLLAGVGMENRPEPANFTRMIRTWYRNVIDAALRTCFPLASGEVFFNWMIIALQYCVGF